MEEEEEEEQEQEEEDEQQEQQETIISCRREEQEEREGGREGGMGRSRRQYASHARSSLSTSCSSLSVLVLFCRSPSSRLREMAS
eukprot:547928-Hanusia_phi.AAC.1